MNSILDESAEVCAIGIMTNVVLWLGSVTDAGLSHRVCGSNRAVVM